MAKTLLRTVNLEEGMPTRHTAVLRLHAELRGARAAGCSLVKVIHGYGSSGTGGVLRVAVGSELRQMKERGEIRAFIYGDDFRISDETTWAAIKKYPELKADRDLGRGNRGLTVVWL